MKRTIAWVLGIGGVSLALVFVLRGQGSTAAESKAAAPSATSSSPPSAATPSQAMGTSETEKVVYTFENQDKMMEFTKVWQRRQGVVVRMTVLQAYWEQERADLDELNKKLSTDYQLDVTKNYSLDTDRRVLIERELPPAQEPVKDAAKDSTPAKPATP